jgi:membrane-associated phospholipid phosphatase
MMTRRKQEARSRRPASLWPAAAGLGLLAALVRSGAASQPMGSVNPADDPGGAAAVGGWRTWVLATGNEIRPAAPPADGSPQTAQEIAELRQLEAQRTEITGTTIQYWNGVPAPQRWTEMTLALIARDKLNSVRSARVLGCVHTAIQDAVVAVWDAKYSYHRRLPGQLAPDLHPALPLSDVPSYPSEHAAVAAAAAGALAGLFPKDATDLAAAAQEAAQSRLLAGANYRSDIEAGAAIGQAVAQKAMARANADGSSAQWAGAVPTGPGLWQGTNPQEPLAGTWKTWILGSGSQLRPGPPPAFGSAQFQAELAEVKRISSNPTPSQRALALFWADGAGTVTPPGHWFQIATDLIARDHWSTPCAARVLGLLGAAVADAGVAGWDAKYTYWLIRPYQADPSIMPLVAPPPHPSYPSGHALYSGASSEVLAYFFPQDAPRLRYLGREAALSRIYGGIHYRSDIDAGGQLGRSVAALAIARDQTNGPCR